MNPKSLTLQQVALELGVTDGTVRRLISKGALRALRVGRVLRIRRADLDAYIAKVTVKGGAA